MKYQRFILANSLQMAEGTIADLTGNIPISLWEDNRVNYHSRSLQDTNICVRFWNGAKKLTTSPNSVISAIQDEKLKSITMEEPSEVPQEDELTVAVPFIKTVEKVQQYPLCIHCGSFQLQ